VRQKSQHQRFREILHERRCRLRWVSVLILHGMALGALLAQPSLAHLTGIDPEAESRSNRSRIHKSVPTHTPNGDTALILERFYSEFAVALAAKLDVTGPSRWEFQVGLSDGAGLGRKARITITASCGGLSVRIGSVPTNGALKRIRSAAVSQDAYLGALATGDPTAIDVLWPGYSKR
jgi:hypothetical protein